MQSAEKRSHKCTEVKKMACTWFGEIPSCCSLTALLGPVWVLLTYVLQTIFSGPVLFVIILPTPAMRICAPQLNFKS